ncbi:hypothetical protein F5Y17DRAFT_462354 [Xylariaceae sp. FL0594]|nr:hypothetical protein F5Y17DRAFT_462354 [Xylariaceae sp. FL0594]
MDKVPTEILLNILEFLDGPAPSEYRLHEEPSQDMFSQSSTPLKTASLVSRTWRILVLPALFRHVLWKPMVSSLSAFTLNPIPLLRFLKENDLARHTVSFTLVIEFEDPIAIEYQVTPKIRTVDLEWLWDRLFSVLDPLRFTILARPSTLAALLSRILYLDDAWTFEIPFHILSLARAGRGAGLPTSVPVGEAEIEDATIDTASAGQTAVQLITPPNRTHAFRPRPREAPPCPLFTMRPWTSVLLNEGSSIKIYRAHEYLVRQPPSMLGVLLGCEERPNDKPLIPSTVVDFNYIAIFPYASHLYTLLDNLPRLDRLFLQVTPRPPRPFDGIRDDEDQMRYTDPRDLINERDAIYEAVVQGLIVEPDPLTPLTPSMSNWGRLRVFESGDRPYRDLWERAVPILARSEVQAWKAAEEGVLVRHVPDTDTDTQEDVQGQQQKINGHSWAPWSLADDDQVSVIVHDQPPPDEQPRFLSGEGLSRLFSDVAIRPTPFHHASEDDWYLEDYEESDDSEE